MTEHFQIIECQLDALAAGASLALDLHDDKGNVLLPAGKILDETLIARLERRGISKVQISVPVLPEEAKAAQQAVRDRIEHVFRRNQGKAAEQLREAILSFRLQGNRK